MKTIYKYPLMLHDESIDMPVGAEILSLQAQIGRPVIWALVDTEQPLHKRRFRTYGTGNAIHDPDGRYIDTFQTHDGVMVWHVFEIAP